MSLDPDLHAFLTARQDAEAAPYWELDAKTARAQSLTATQPRPDGVSVEDLSIENADGEPMRIRIYRPERAEPTPPVVVFFHGSGWVICGIETHDHVVAAMALASRCVWVSVDYRLAPEAKFPAAVNDCIAATAWVAQNADRYGFDGTRLALAGDSAGGNLAAVVGLMAPTQHVPAISAQLLAYPVLDLRLDRSSYKTNGVYGLDEGRMRWFAAHYLDQATDSADWRVAPMNAPHLAVSPPTILFVGEFDVLRDEAVEYAQRLTWAGVEVDFTIERGMNHGFLNHPIPHARRCLVDYGALLGRRLGAIE